MEAAQHLPMLLLQESHAVLQVRDPGCSISSADDEPAPALLGWRLLQLKESIQYVRHALDHVMRKDGHVTERGMMGRILVGETEDCLKRCDGIIIFFYCS